MIISVCPTQCQSFLYLIWQHQKWYLSTGCSTWWTLNHIIDNFPKLESTVKNPTLLMLSISIYSVCFSCFEWECRETLQMLFSPCTKNKLKVCVFFFWHLRFSYCHSPVTCPSLLRQYFTKVKQDKPTRIAILFCLKHFGSHGWLFLATQISTQMSLL